MNNEKVIFNQAYPNSHIIQDEMVDKPLSSPALLIPLCNEAATLKTKSELLQWSLIQIPKWNQFTHISEPQNSLVT